MLRLFVGALLLWPFAGQAAAGEAGNRESGNRESGKAVVESWCASCHHASGARVGRDAAPPFLAIAKRRHFDASMLQRVLADPHPPMPRVSLTRRQVDDVVAYLRALREGK